MIEVRQGGRRRIDRVLAAGYTDGIEQRSLVDVRQLRDEAAQEESELSYLRRLLHGRIDIVRAEQQRRSVGSTTHVVDQLAGILAEGAVDQTKLAGRPANPEPQRVGSHRRQVEALLADVDLTDVSSMSDEQLGRALRHYLNAESDVSTRRREVQDVVDTLNAEIGRRYSQGSASVDALLETDSPKDPAE
ncbi:MAG: aerial mycelium formation protein [Sciscionella sp.]|nr:aerial mycelium formation protein [Sciscionella sp.]